MNTYAKVIIPMASIDHEQSVKGTYAVISKMLKKGGIYELTEGRFEENLTRSYEEAQKLQQKHLLKLVNLKKGNSFLDVGCGHGVLLREAKKQGILGIGITLSEDQKEDHRGLETYVLNWRDILKNKPDWKNQFDAITAIGSLEHFVSPEEAKNGIQNEIYQAFFEVCFQLLKPEGKLIITAINYLPEKVLNPIYATNSYLKPWRWFNKNQFHLGSLAWLGGAYYPILGELPPIGQKIGFHLIQEEDGTLDYHLTSEEWLRLLKEKMFQTNLAKEILQLFKQYPSHSVLGAFLCLIVFQSWNWQFRKQKNGGYPTKLVRYVWKK